MNKNILVLAGVALIGLGIALYRGPLMSVPQPNPELPAEQLPSSMTPSDLDVLPFAREFEYTATESGQTALDLLKQYNIIEVKAFGFGTMITGIEGLMADENNYWAFYVNGEYAKQAADQTNLNAGDTVRFVYEPVSGAEAMDAE